MEEKNTCKGCGNQFAGKFCNACGEQVYYDKDKRLKNVFEEVVHFITHYDNSFFISLKTSLTKPGKLSDDYCNGIRKKYFKPIPFFLLVVVLYLLFPRFQGLNMNADTYATEKYDFTWLSIPVFKAKMKKHNATYREIANRYNEKSPKISKVSLLFLIPLGSFVLAGLFINKKKYFFDHFILSAEITSFYIFSQFLVLPFIAFVVEKISPEFLYVFDDESWVWWIAYSILGIFTTICFRTFYKETYWISITKGVLFLAIFLLFIKYIYSIIVFLLTMLFV